MDILKQVKEKIPKEVSHVTSTLKDAGFEAYLVGGCVRDLLMDREPKDWDVTTNAKPEQIINLFEKTVYENTFGTVGVVVSQGTSEINVSQETLEPRTLPIEQAGSNPESNFIVEVTPYRIEAKYSDFRHPDEVKFSDKLEDDIKRRDFTVNAMAYSISKGQLVDMFDGLKDIKDKMLKAVGNPDDRFTEDALRMLRAIRFAVQLDFSISSETSESIFKNSDLIKNISQERIRDEFIKIIMSKNPASGIMMLQKFGLLKNIIPELEEGIGCEQSGEHIYDVWNHLLHALQHSADKNWPLEIRLSALFHDIGKPKSRRLAETEGSALRRLHTELAPQGRTLGIQKGSTFSRHKKFTFYGHEVIGARMTKKILERLKFSKKEIDLVEKLIYTHMFFSDTEQITLSAVRRIIVKVGPADAKALAGKAENHPIWDLMKVRECDRVGMKKKEAPYRLRKYFAMIEEALHDPISVGQLKINGEDLKDIGIKPGPRMGWILNALLEEVLDDSSKNTKEHLSELTKSLNLLPDDALRTLGERGKEKKEELEEEEIAKLHEKHGVHK
ncbi:MAG: CCA tRNA nucleotidyltransferase [Patescibacteria group bacterium]